MTSPFGPLVVIVNPRSRRGRAEAKIPKIERILRDEGLGYRIARTTHPRHATKVARDALQGGEQYLVAVGGDGTVHEVVNGMLRENEPIAANAVLGVVPVGSGCDFVKSFNLPGDTARAAHRLSGDSVRPIDVGKVTFTSGNAKITRYFLNIAEVGLGGAVVARASRLTGFLGPTRYFCGFWLTLPTFRPTTVQIDADGKAFAWRAQNVVVANCQFYGDGMHISPKSEPDDGALDVLVMVGPKSDAFTTLPKVYRGTHLPHHNIMELKANCLQVEADAPLLIEADGEILGTTPATFEIIPKPVLLKV